MQRPERPVRRPRTVPGTREEILSWLETHGVDDKDRRAEAGKRLARIMHAPQKKRLTLDLHGLKSDEAERKIVQAIDICHAEGIRELLVIHGRGLHSGELETPVLKTLVRSLLDGRLKERMRTWRPAHPDEGGEGATVIFLI